MRRVAWPTSNLHLRNSSSSSSNAEAQVSETRLLYVEDDPALRTIMASLLAKHPSIKLVAAVADSVAAEKAFQDFTIDAALIDVALGAKSANGIELATRLKLRNPYLGIVIYSQHASARFTKDLPSNVREGWSVVQKSAKIDIPYLVEVITATAKGLSVVDPRLSDTQDGSDALEQLTTRQHEIMAFLTEGIELPEIAKKLSLSAVTIRQEMSRIYKHLVPNPNPGVDLRTTAILKYLRLSRSYAWPLDE